MLGSLLEKQRTVPATYPLSLNALRTACNQTTNREPVTNYDDPTISAAIDRLKARELARTVWAGGGSRVLKYHQRLDEALALSDPDRAVLTVLLLRGPQSAGELRTRTERLHPFTDRSTLQATLESMAAAGLVEELSRRPGQQEPRWTHLLGPEHSRELPAAVDREAPLAEGVGARNARVRDHYDALADAATPPGGDLGDKPLDCWLLDQVAGLCRGGPLADVGCGQGQVSAHLAAAGAAVTGIDLSPAMIARASAEHPDLSFVVGDFARLLRPPTAVGWSAITAWYAFGHLAASELGPTITALGNTLVPGGWLAVAVEVGDEEDDSEGLRTIRHDPRAVRAAVSSAGLTDVEWYLRSAYPGESGSEHLLVLARRPGA